MSDNDKALVERLRWGGWYFDHPYDGNAYASDDPLEAADRIEALETQLKTVLDREADTHCRHDAKVDALEAEINYLRKWVDSMIGSMADITALAMPAQFVIDRAALGETE